MGFSIFGWKSGRSKKAEGKPVRGKAPVAKPKPSPAKPASPAKPTGGAQAQGEDSLDFSAYAPPPISDPRAEARPEVAPATSHSAPPRLEEAPAAAPAAPLTAEILMPLSPAAPPARRGPDSAARAEAAAPDEYAPVIEEAAIFFANGQVVQALAALSRAVREEDLGASALQAWLMLFDLYQHLGMSAEFEALAMEFAVKFERSPPVWIETGPRSDPALVTGGIGYCALSGTLSEASAPELQKLRDIAEKLHTVRMDCAKLQGLDAPGCRLLRETLTSIRGAGREVMITGETQLLGLLDEPCQVGKTETDDALWALLLEVYRILKLKDMFEETAVNYAVTFEVSPPSWDSQPSARPKRAAVERPVEAEDRALALSGDVTGASEALAQQLQDWAAANAMLVIDMSRAKRVDFVTAGLMLKVLSRLHQDGTTIQIRGANALIHALFAVMGIGKVARIVPRK
ncbi:MAG TPA: STAS domain-containing protein [Burkholderiales bacterium]|nr:STAS domain-containing protein [Burkholderiales bacterium]